MICYGYPLGEIIEPTEQSRAILEYLLQDLHLCGEKTDRKSSSERASLPYQSIIPIIRAIGYQAAVYSILLLEKECYILLTKKYALSISAHIML